MVVAWSAPTHEFCSYFRFDQNNVRIFPYYEAGNQKDTMYIADCATGMCKIGDQINTF